ncbi:MAG: hypothetical protein LW860_01305 [Xanthomonadaceae bacterium]|nr:hypothetical protein [Xanthomonadaceae bacterium]
MSYTVDSVGPSTVLYSGRPSALIRRVTTRRRPGPAVLTAVMPASDTGRVLRLNVPSAFTCRAVVGSGVMRPSLPTQNTLTSTSFGVVPSARLSWPLTCTRSRGRGVGLLLAMPVGSANTPVNGAATLTVVLPLRATSRPESSSATRVTLAGRLAGMSAGATKRSAWLAPATFTGPATTRPA